MRFKTNDENQVEVGVPWDVFEQVGWVTKGELTEVCSKRLSRLGIKGGYP